MKLLHITLLIVAGLGHAISTYTAQEKEKEAAAQEAALSPRDARHLKEYIDEYQQFKKAVLDKDLQQAPSLLNRLQDYYAMYLPYNIRKALYQEIPDDEITYRLNVKPSEPTFFLQAFALLDRMQQKAEPPFPPLSLSKKQQPPTPPMFISTPRKITGQFTTDSFKENITFGAIEPAKNLLMQIFLKETLRALYLITTMPSTIKDMRVTDRPSLLNQENYAVIEYLLQNDRQLQINKDELLRYALSKSVNIPMIELLLKYGAKIDNSVVQIKLPSKDINIILRALYDLFGEDKVRRILNTAESSPFLSTTNLWPTPLKMLIDENLNLDVKDVNGQSPIELLMKEMEKYHSFSEYSENLAKSLQYILESQQLQNDPELKEKLINMPNAQGLKPLCAAAEAQWVEGAKLLIWHGADCADEKYKDFLVPLIKEVEKPRAEKTVQVIHEELPETRSRLHPLPTKVKAYVAGEEERSRPATPVEEPTPSTGPETEVD